MIFLIFVGCFNFEMHQFFFSTTCVESVYILCFFWVLCEYIEFMLLVFLLQDDKDLVHEFVMAEGLTCLIKVGAEADQNYQNYILRGTTSPHMNICKSFF